MDIFFLIIFIRVAYVALKNGFPAELFKLLGTLFAIYLSLHYYVDLSDYLTGQVKINFLPEYLALFSFAALALFGYFSFAFLGRLLSRFMQMEAAPKLNKWGGLILGLARSFLLASLIIFSFVVIPLGYFKHSVRDSYYGKRLLAIAPGAYTWLWQSVVSKFRGSEKFNDSVTKIQKDLAKK
ncbi:MAG: CvpA family protein [Candidatus Omnitrophica bacterium]|nr:CvpA family protein [Candidatus Omnitrophota bacterium]